jgi:hypothetical protein
MNRYQKAEIKRGELSRCFRDKKGKQSPDGYKIYLIQLPGSVFIRGHLPVNKSRRIMMLTYSVTISNFPF